MSIFEYDEKLHEKTMMDIGREEGLQQGLQQATQQGITALITTLKEINCSDETIIEKLMNRFDLNETKAREYLTKYSQKKGVKSLLIYQDFTPSLLYHILKKVEHIIGILLNMMCSTLYLENMI